MAESTAANETTTDRKLNEIFDEAYHLYDSLEGNNEPTNSSEVQQSVKNCINLFEEATKLVSAVGLYSSNEVYEEIATNDLKYLLLPYFLGQLTLKLCLTDRRNVVEVADVYYRDFLKRCEEYDLHKTSTELAVSQRRGGGDEMAELMQMASQRNSKLEQYRLKKELDEQIKQIKVLMEREHIDDDAKRDFFIKLIKSSIMETQNELSSIEQEKQILDHMQKMRHENPNDDSHKMPPKRQPSAPLKPIIITKDAMQKAVYGLGYPSLPTMTVDEFYEQRVKDGIFPDPTKVRDPNSLQSRAMRGETDELDEQEDIQKEQDIENDDEIYLARARAMDEFKDNVKKGEGNRYNRS